MPQFSTTPGSADYLWSLPPAADLRWDTPRQFQGQIVEWQYAEEGSATVQNDGAQWARKIDHSSGEVTYYQRARTILVTVTEDDIRHGDPFDGARDAIHLAARRAEFFRDLDPTAFRVESTRIAYVPADGVTRYTLLPMAALIYAEDAPAGRHCEPFTFTVYLPGFPDLDRADA